MRDLINLIENLSLDESTGGIARRWIEVQSGMDIPFVNSNTKEAYSLVDLFFLPPDPQYKYEDDEGKSGKDILDMNIQNIVESLSPSPLNVDVYGIPDGRAAIVAVMKNEQNENFVFVKKTKTKANLGPNAIFWQTSEFAKQTGLWAQTAQMKKAAIPIEPTDFVSEGTKYPIGNLPKVVAEGIAKINVPKELKVGLPEIINNLVSGKTTPVPGLAEFQSAIEIKLSELAAPIALKYGNFVVGDYATVNKDLLEPMGTSWSKANAVSFPPKAEKLIDTTLWFGNDKIDISVKDSSGGGRPSTATIAETLAKGGFDNKFLSKYKNEIAAIEELDGKSMQQGPIDLCVKYGALDSSDVAFLNSIYKKGIKKVKEIPPNWQNLLETIPYKPDDTHPEYQLGFHLMAVAARYVARQLNQDPDKITDFFKEVLNKSSLVQVYCKTKADKQGGLYYSQFGVVWPPVFTGTIQVDADSYTARTPPSRKISFSFKTSKAKDQYSEPSSSATTKEITPADIEVKDLRTPAAKAARTKAGYEKEIPKLTRARR